MAVALLPLQVEENSTVEESMVRFLEVVPQVTKLVKVSLPVPGAPR